MPFPDQFHYDPSLLATFGSIRAGIVHATGLENGPAPTELSRVFLAQQQETKATMASSMADIASIAAWRKVFPQFGVTPTKYRNAAESLLRRLAKQGGIPSINLLVDIGNLVSIRHALPVAVLDLAQATGRTTVRFAEGTESFSDLGSSGTQAPEVGEVIFVDEAGLVSARRWCWRQSAQSAAGPSLSEALIVVEGHHDEADADTKAAVSDLVELLEQFQPQAQLRTGFASVDSPTF